jgi:uncharacterized protein (DUF1778 family)
MKTKSLKQRKTPANTTLMIRLDRQSKAQLHKAAKLRHMSLSDYVRQVAVPQARREVQAAKQGMIVLSREGQIAFWDALHAPVKMTPRLRKLGAMIRGEE